MGNRFYNKFQQFIDYFLFGSVTAFISVALFLLLNDVWGIQYLIANIIAITIAILFSYVVNKRYVFKTHVETKKAMIKEFLLFVSLRSTAAAIDMAGIFILVQLFDLDATIAKIGIQAVIAASNYAVSKWIIFKKKTDGKDE